MTPSSKTNLLVVGIGEVLWNLLPDGHFFRPTPVVEVADTVGAGDSFTAAFIASLLRGDSIEQAHECATLVSAYVCTRNGAMPLLPKELTAGLHQ